MPITRLNHAVLYVRDLTRSVAFYTDVLGFRPVAMTPAGFSGAAFLQAPGSTNDHDIGLFQIGPEAGPSLAGRSTVGLYHLAWEVDTLAELERLAGVLTELPTKGKGWTKARRDKWMTTFETVVDFGIPIVDEEEPDEEDETEETDETLDES